MEVHILPRDNSNACLVFRNGYYGHPGTHIDPGGGGWTHEPGAGAGAEQGAGHVAREGSPGTMGHHYQHLQSQAPGPQPAMYPCKMPGGPPRSAGRTTELAVVLTLSCFSPVEKLVEGEGGAALYPGHAPYVPCSGSPGGGGVAGGGPPYGHPGGGHQAPPPPHPAYGQPSPAAGGQHSAQPAQPGQGGGGGGGGGAAPLPSPLYPWMRSQFGNGTVTLFSYYITTLLYHYLHIYSEKLRMVKGRLPSQHQWPKFYS